MVLNLPRCSYKHGTGYSRIGDANTNLICITLKLRDLRTIAVEVVSKLVVILINMRDTIPRLRNIVINVVKANSAEINFCTVNCAVTMTASYPNRTN